MHDDLKAQLIVLDDGRTLDPRHMTDGDLRGVIKSMEMDVIANGQLAEKMPSGYVSLVRELYQRTGGRAPGTPSKVAVYGDSKRSKSTWRKL